MDEPFTPKEIINWKVSKVLFRAERQRYAFRVSLWLEGEQKEQIKENGGFLTKAEAQLARDETYADLHAGCYAYEISLTVKEYMDWWITYFTEERDPTYETCYTYRSTIRNHIVPALGSIKLKNLTQSILLDKIEQIAKKSLSQAKMVLAIMRTSLSTAFEKHLTASNLSIGLNLPKSVKEQSK